MNKLLYFSIIIFGLTNVKQEKFVLFLFYQLSK